MKFASAPRWRYRLVLALTVGLGLTTAACKWAFHGEPSLVTHEAPPVIFSHKRHVDGQVDCLKCHESIARSAVTTGSDLPKRTVCGECHDTDVVARSTTELENLEPHRGGLLFSHEAHLPRVKGDCLACHTSIPKSDAYGQHSPPGMETCTPCHEAQMAKNQCTSCHERERLAGIRPARFLSHEGDWVQRHKDRALGSTATCAQCHTQNYCVDCHNRYETLKPSTKYPDQVTRQLIHRGDFVSRHAIEARGSAAQCLTCHSVSSCDSCHALQGVSYAATASGGQGLSRTPHSLNFMDRTASDFHGRAARRDIVACASCHDQGPATNCIACHKSGRYGGNPHPAGFSSNLDRRTTPMCQWCHEGR